MNYASVNDTTKLLVCGGIAGAFISRAGPLAQVDDFKPLQGTNAAAGMERLVGKGVHRELASTDSRHRGRDGAVERNGVTIIHRLPYSASLLSSKS